MRQTVSLSDHGAPLRLCLLLSLACLVGAACQTSHFEYQPDGRHQAGHLRFPVQQPSKADLLFVVDNTGSMATKQAALANSMSQLLAGLAPQSTSYRIGIVSTDIYGFETSCAPGNVLNPRVPSNARALKGGDAAKGAKGNCGRPEVLLARPHDGALGRLIAAYDPKVFDPNNFTNVPTSTPGSFNPHAALISLLPRQVSDARAVIDHDILQAQACTACGCGTGCLLGQICYNECAAPVTQALVQAYFTSNIQGLGTSGFGWPGGMRAAMWAIGVDPDEVNPLSTPPISLADRAKALNPVYNLVAANGPNSFTDPTVQDANATSWVRDDAILAVLFLSDAEDCSMPEDLTQKRSLLEQVPYPTGKTLVGSICSNRTLQPQFHKPSDIASLLSAAKGDVKARVAVGVIGSLSTTGKTAAGANTDAVAADCVIANSAAPPTTCSCLTSNTAASDSNDVGWCSLTQNTQGPNMGLPTCDGQAASRYVNLASDFLRHSYESVCRADAASFGPMLANFARIATRPCFELNAVRPFTGDPNYLAVARTPLNSTITSQLAQQDPLSSSPGYYYDAQTNEICLTGLQRIIGDAYDIFVYDVSVNDFTK